MVAKMRYGERLRASALSTVLRDGHTGGWEPEVVPDGLRH